MKNLKMKSLLIVLTILIGQIAYSLNPSRTYKQRPEKYNMEYKEVKVKTNDGLAELNVWEFPCKTLGASEWVLIAHNGEGNMADYLRRVDQFRGDFNVVIFDYRGFGESSEFAIDNNMYIYPHFQDDMETMIDHCRKSHTATFNIYGWGIGGGLALGVGYHRPETNKIIADTPFYSMEDLEERFSSWDEPLEVPFAGYDKRNEPIYALDNAAGKALSGVKLIIGSNDILYSTDDMEKLRKKSKLISEIYIVENPDRKDNFRVDKTGYYPACQEFLKK